MTKQERVRLISRNCQEVLTEEDLSQLVESGKELVHYIGFEISGMVHLGTGLVSMGKIADLLEAGVKCQILLADFHSFLNKKLDGKWETIRQATDMYFREGLVASLNCFGVEADKIKFVTSRELYHDNLKHWETFMEVGQHVTLSRNLRSISIMGKRQGKEVDMATLFYPPLQVADIFSLNVNLAQAGIDQRKAHVIARQVGEKIGRWKPIAIHHNLIAGLTGPEPGKNDQESLKMSKSKPGSAIFVHDSPEVISDKIKKAYGPPKQAEYNPLLNWVETLVFWGEKELPTGFEIKRPERYGGDVVYQEIDRLIEDYREGKLYPTDLKNALANWLIAKLEPARKHFESGKAKEGLKLMKRLVK